jgi:DNA-binding SARP family transcriptional activator/tetratricopeptide (TPR) repeat protein/DNA-binding XRE family transcriptional regulator
MSRELALGPLIRTLRISAGLTQREAADRAGLSLGALRDLEQGRTGMPRARSLRALATALGADPERLLSAPTSQPATGHGEPGTATIGILGPLILRSSSGSIAVRGRAVRTVLGLLALHPNEYVGYEQFVERIWDGGQPPQSWRALLHSHLARARRLLVSADPTGAIKIASAAQRYRLQIEPSRLDASAFVTDIDHAMTIPDSAAACALYSDAFDRWRGPVLSDVAELSQHPRAARLAEVRLASAVAFADAALAARQPDRALATLTDMCQSDPLNEGLVAKQLRLLAGSGRLADAGELYRATRSLLADELGVEPSTHLHATYIRVLNDRAEPADERDQVWLTSQSVQPPRQLPRELPDFVGRNFETARLTGYLAAAQADPTASTTAANRLGPPTAAIVGMGGLGKTSLAVRVAHRVAADYPSGQLFANLEADGVAVEPARVLEHFLVAIGHPTDRLPTELAQLAALFRSILAGGRYLVVLDNVRSAEQVVPLLPGDASSAVLITSRNRLADLDGLHRLELAPLSEAESLRMLESLADQAATVQTRDAVREVSRLCGGLPLALRLAAARRITDPNTDLAQIAAQLGGTGLRLDTLRSPGRAIRRLLESSYAELPPGIARALPLVTLIPGRDFSLAVAARALDEPLAQTRASLDGLCYASLLLSSGQGRFQLHDIVAEFGQELLSQAPAEQRRAAQQRILRWYIDTAQQASQLVYPQRVTANPTSTGPDAVAAAGAAVGWLTQERVNLVAAIAQAHDLGSGEFTWQLVDAATGAFRLHAGTQDWLAAAQRGLAAATRLQHWPAITMMHESLARAHAARSEHARAVEHYRAGLEAADRADWLRATVSLLENLSISLWMAGELAEAQQLLKKAIELSRQTGQRFFEAASLNDLGNIRLTRGYCREAITYYQAAMDINIEIGDEDGRLVNLSNIAESRLRLGETDAARRLYETLLAGQTRTGDPSWLARNLAQLSNIDRIEGNAFHASSLADQAIELVTGQEDQLARAEVLLADSLAKASIGLPDFGRRQAEESLRAAREINSPAVLLPALLGLARLLGNADPPRARDVVAEALAVAQDLGDLLSEAEALLLSAQLSVELGRSQVAGRLGQQARQRFRQVEHHTGERAATEFLGGLATGAGLLAVR